MVGEVAVVGVIDFQAHQKHAADFHLAPSSPGGSDGERSLAPTPSERRLGRGPGVSGRDGAPEDVRRSPLGDAEPVPVHLVQLPGLTSRAAAAFVDLATTRLRDVLSRGP